VAGHEVSLPDEDD